MAKPSKTSVGNVTRIKASDDSVSKSSKKDSSKKEKKSLRKTETAKAVSGKMQIEKNSESSSGRRNPLLALKEYFKGAWYELTQVRWPDRRSTWGMTGALLAFTAVFVLIILVLDAFFKYIFQLLLG